MTPPPTGGTVTGNGLACGTGGAACAVTFDSATTAALTATPDTGYTFTGWGGDCAGTAASTTVQVDAVRTCSAFFAPTLARCEQHPADANGDFRLAIGEVTAYGAAWKKGDTWTVPPVPIPIGYVTRAGYLWRVGETYRRDVGDGPFCWLPLIAGDAVLTSVDPAAGEQGAGPIVATVTASGTHFFQGTTEVSFGAGVTVSGVQVQSLTQLTASLAVAAGAAVGPRDVSTITDGEVATLAGAFRVTLHRSVPVPNAGGPYNGTAGIAVSFDGSLSADPDGNPLAFTWDFGDGNTGSGTTPSHAYAAAGQFSVTLRVDNGHGGAANAATTVTISPASVNPGIGFLRGGAFDDSRGLPLATPIIRVLRAAGQPLPAPPTTGGDVQGRFLAQAAQGEALVEVSASGFTSVYRTASVVGRASVTLLDARLTPLEPASQPITSALGGLARTPDGGQSVQFMAGSLPADAAVGVTPLSAQGLPLRLPFGWSPVAAVDVRPLATSLGVPAVWRASNAAGIPRSRELALVRFDRDALRWIVGGTAAVSGDGQFIEAAIDRLGAWVIVAPDAAPFTPTAPQPGSELTGVAEPPLPGTISATGHVSPRTAPPGQQARAIGAVVLQSSEPLVSGVRLQGRVTQRFDLQDGASVVPLPFTQDVLVYTDPATGLTSELRARIPITPSRNYSLQELLLGVVQVDVHQPGSNTNGILVDVGGGAFDDGAGARLTVPAGAVTLQTVIDLVPLPRDQLSAPVPGGVEFLGGVRFGLIGANLPQSATISIPKPSGLPPDAQILLAQTFFDFLGVPHLRVAAVGTLDGNRIVSATQAGDLQLPGVVTGGEYAFVRATTPLGFARGIVFAPDGTTPRTLALLTAETGPFADLTGTTGRYIAMTPVAAATRVFATDAPGNVGSNSVSPAQVNAVVTANVTLAATAPTVVSADPAQGATRVPLDTGLRVQFSKAIAAASVTETSVSLRQGGAPVTLQRFLSIDGRTLTLLPGHALSSATSYELVLTTDLRDPVGNALAASQTLSFTTIDTSRQVTAPGQLVARLPDDDGFVMLFGSPGTAEPSALVSVINLRSQETMTVVAQSDGSFRLRILALLGDELTVHFRNAAGQEADFTISQLENEDGLAGLGAAGGTVRGAGGRVATVLPRALVKAGTFRLLAGSTLNLPPLPAGDVVVDALALTITGAQFNPLSSLTVFETQGRFAPATASALPFTATGSLVVAPDFLVGGALKFRAIGQDAQGNQVRVDALTTVRSADPDRTIVETASEARFPRVFVSTPREAVPNQEVDVTATVPTARVDFELPVPAGPLAAYLLVRESQLGTESKLSILDTLVPTATDAGPRLRTAGRELPGVSQSGAYAVIGSPTARSFATGRLTGPALTVDVEGSPFVYETNGPNALFTVPVPANGPFTLRFVDPASGDLRGTFVGHSTGPGTIDIGEPLGHTAQTMTVSAKPDETWSADIDMPIEFAFSEPVDMPTVNAGTIVVTDASGHRVFGRFTESGDSRTVAFTPLRRLRYATRYRYNVTTRVTAVSGAHLQAAFSREFTTFEPRALAAPDVGEPVKDVAVSGGVALAAGASGLSVFGIANPMQPVLRARVAQAGGSSGVALTDGGFTDRAGTAAAGPVAVLSGGSQSTGGRVNVLGLQNPSGPQSLGAVSVGQAGVAAAGRIAIDGARAAVLDGVGASILDLAQAVPPDPADATRGVLARSTATSLVNAKDVAYVGSKVLVVGEAGLSILDAATLDVLGTRAADGPAVTVDGLPQFDLDIDGNGTIDPNTEHFDLAVAGGGSDGTLRFYDISRPAAIRLVGVVHLAGDVQDVALSASEQLAYVAAGLAGVVIVDLHGPTSIQPLDVDFDGDDDRILGSVATAASASRVSVDSARSLAVAGTGQRLSVLQVAPMHARILTILRDPVLAAPGDEQPLVNGVDAFTTDDAIRVAVDTGADASTAFLTVTEAPTSIDPLLGLPGGVESVPLSAGQSTIELRNRGTDISSQRTATVRLVNAAGEVFDTATIRLALPDVSQTRLKSMYVAPQELTLDETTTSAQLGVGGRFEDGRNLNLTRASSGTTHGSSEPIVATVSADGMVDALVGGNALVTSVNFGERVSARVTVNRRAKLTALSLSPHDVLLRRPEEVRQLTLFGTYSDGRHEDVTGMAGVSFVSSNSTVATVDALGRLKAVSEGGAVVSATIDGIRTDMSVGVEFSEPARVLSVALRPFAASVDTDTLVPVEAQLTGSGGLAGLSVSFSVSGPSTFSSTALADYDGKASTKLAGFSQPGTWTVTARVVDPGTGTTLTDTAVVTVVASGRDAEPNDSTAPVSLAIGGEVLGALGDGDPEDAFGINLSYSGDLAIEIVFDGGVFPLQATAVLRDGTGGELARANAADGVIRLTVGVSGRVVVSISAPQTVRYRLNTRFTQAPVTVTSVAPSSGGTGTVVTVSGQGFGTDPSSVRVMFGGVPGKVLDVAPTTIRVQVPALAVNGDLGIVVGERALVAAAFSVGREGSARPVHFSNPAPPATRLHPTLLTPVSVNRLIITADPLSTSARISQLVQNEGGVIITVLPALHTYVAAFPNIVSLRDLEAGRARIRLQPEIISVELSARVKLSAAGPYDGETQQLTGAFGAVAAGMAAFKSAYIFDAIEEARKNRRLADAGNLNRVRVSVIDSGLNPPDEFRGKFLNATLSRVAGSSPETGEMLWVKRQVNRPDWIGDDPTGHGTAMTSIIAARNHGTGFGMSGVLGSVVTPAETWERKAEFYSVDVYQAQDDDFWGFADNVLAALSAATASPGESDANRTPHVVNLSLGFPSDFPTCSLVGEVFRLQPDTLFVVAAGNENVEAWRSCPAVFSLAYRNVITVGAVGVANLDETGEQGAGRAVWRTQADPFPTVPLCGMWHGQASNCGFSVTLAAPGEDFLVIMPGGLKVRNLDSGTSLATALTSGVAGLLHAVSPNPLTPGDIRDILVASGTDITETWRDGERGGGTAANDDPFRSPALPLRRLNALDAVRLLLQEPEWPRILVADAVERGSAGGANSHLVSVAVAPLGGRIYLEGADEFTSPRSVPLKWSVPLEGQKNPDGTTAIVHLDLARTNSIAVSPNRREAYLTAEAVGLQRSGIAVVKLPDLTVDEFIDLSGGPVVTVAGQGRPNVPAGGRHSLAVSPDGRLLYVATATGLTLINLETRKVVEDYRDLPVPGGVSDESRPIALLTWRLRDLEKVLSNGGAVPASISLSSDGRTLFLATTPDASRRSRVLQVDVDLTKDADTAKPGRQVDLSGFLLVSEQEAPTLSMMATLSGGAPDISKDVSASPDGKYVYLLHGRYRFNPSADGPLIVNSPGTMGVFNRALAPQTNGEPVGRILVSDVLGSPFTLPKVRAEAPSALALSEDGRRGLVGFYLTGNFGLLDLDRQRQQGLGDPADRPDFRGYIGRTLPIELDSDYWPRAPQDLARMYPVDLAFGQNGRFAVSAHAGTSGSPVCASDPTNQACSQHGGISLINVEGMSQDAKANASEQVEWFGRKTGFFGVNPLCGGEDSSAPATYGCGTRGRAQPAVFSSTFTPFGTAPVHFIAPQAVAVEPMVTIDSPKAGDRAAIGDTVHFTWKQTPDALASRYQLELQQRDVPSGPPIKEGTFSLDQLTARAASFTLEGLFSGAGTPLRPTWYVLTLRVYTNSAACGEPLPPGGCLLSSTKIEFELEPKAP